jgi:hypothetical protein
MGIVIEIEGVDKTSSCLINQLSITDELNSRNTYNFGVVSTDGSYRPAVGNEAVVYAQEHYSDSRDIGDATFTRTSVATKQDGTQVASGEARYETGQYSQAIMVEEGTTNLLTANQSDVETDTTGFAAYAALGGTVTLTRDTGEYWQGVASLKVVCDGTQAQQGFEISCNVISGSIYTYSLYLKMPSAITLLWRFYGATNVAVQFSTVSGWSRYSYAFTATATGAANLVVRTVNAQAVTFYADGLQLE